MRHDDKSERAQLLERSRAKPEEREADGHVVFDFTGLQQTDVGDLALILTARLAAAPNDTVWTRSLPYRTAEILRILKLDHLFQAYPEGEGQLN